MHGKTLPYMTADEINAFFDAEFPQLNPDGRLYKVTETGPGFATLQLEASTGHLRPGGTVSGPVLFTLADVGCYAALLAQIGPVGLAVTTSLNINFLRKPGPGTLTCTSRILKLGKRLAVLEASIFADVGNDLIAHATTTYSIPPREK